MGICVLTEDKWCDRHKTYHKGRLYELSQLDTELGEKYRKFWDHKKPCNCKKRKNEHTSSADKQT